MDKMAYGRNYSSIIVSIECFWIKHFNLSSVNGANENNYDYILT